MATATASAAAATPSHLHARKTREKAEGKTKRERDPRTVRERNPRVDKLGAFRSFLSLSSRVSGRAGERESGT